MPLYHWRGIDQQGVSQKGSSFADSQDSLKLLLKKSDIGLVHAQKKLLHTNVSSGQKDAFFAHLASLLSAYIPLYEALCTMSHTATSEHIRLILEDMALQVSQGTSFIEVLKMHDFLDPLTRALVTVGEATGALGPLLNQLVAYRKEGAAASARITQALLTPLITLSFFGIVCVGMLVWVVPLFGEYFLSYQVTLPWMTRALISISALLTKNALLWGALASLVLILCGKALLYTTWGRARSELVRDWLPIVGSMYRMRVHSRILKVVGMLVSQQVPLSSALQASEALMSPSGYAEALRRMRAAVDAGIVFSQAWHESRLRCPEIEAFLMLGETSGRLGDMMLHAALLFERRLDERFQRCVVFLNPLLLLLTALLVAGLISAIYMPLITLSSSLG